MLRSLTFLLYVSSKTNHSFTWPNKQFDFVPSEVQHSIEHVLFSGGKNMLNNKLELLQTNDENLFGKEFSDHLTKKSSKEVFLKFDASKKLFLSNPSFQQQQPKSRVKKQIATGNRGNQAKQNCSCSRKDTNV